MDLTEMKSALQSLDYAEVGPPEILSLDSDFSSSASWILDSPERHHVNQINDSTLIADTSTLGSSEGNSTNYNAHSNKQALLSQMSYCTPLPKTHCSGLENGDKTINNNFQASHYRRNCHSPLSNDCMPECQTFYVSNDIASGLTKNDQSDDERLSGCLKKYGDMQYAELTHKQLTGSLNRIHEQNNKYTSETSSKEKCKIKMPLREETSSCRAAVDDNLAKDLTPSQTCSKSSISENHNQFSIMKNTELYKAPYAAKLNAVLQVKDDLLHEKEATILKLRLQVASMQHQVLESETALRQVGKRLSPSSYLPLSDSRDHCQVQKIYELEQMLGKTENKLLETSMHFQQERKKMEEKIKGLEIALKSRDKAYADISKRHKNSEDKAENCRRRIESLERYLSDLPTIEESNELRKEAERLTAERNLLAVQVADYKDRSQALDLKILKKDDEIESLKQKSSYIHSQVEELQSKFDKSELSKRSLEKTERDELEDLRIKVERLIQEKITASIVLSGYEKKMKSVHDQQNMEKNSLQMEINEANELTALSQREHKAKQKTANEFHLSSTNLGAQNQELLDENLTLKEKVKNLEKLCDSDGDVWKVMSKWQQELTGALNDLRSVVQVLVETSKGNDPNISVLLGVESDSRMSSDEFESTGIGENPFASVSIEDLNRSFNGAQKLREDINQLRIKLSHYYADKIGSNCITH